MKQQEFERKVLALWTETQVPMTRANLLIHTEAPRQQLDGWLKEMVRDGLLELDSDDDGEMVWTVRGAKRPAKGRASAASGGGQALASLKGQMDGLAREAALNALGIKSPRDESVPTHDRKSLLASGLLSFFFGPVGWFYAAPLKEAVPATLLFALITTVIPKFILAWFMGPLLPLSALVGVLYAWSYNRNGRRLPLVLKDPPAQLPPGPPRRGRLLS